MEIKNHYKICFNKIAIENLQYEDDLIPQDIYEDQFQFKDSPQNKINKHSSNNFIDDFNKTDDVFGLAKKNPLLKNQIQVIIIIKFIFINFKNMILKLLNMKK